jgi:tRNA (cytosine38-C5)-methyltransferase
MHTGIGVELTSQVVASFEINQHAQLVHQANTSSGCQAVGKGIETVRPKEIDALKADVWLLSPPCQPFTRQGAQQGIEDARCAALQHVLDTLLVECVCKPQLMYVENVKGFETSSARDELVAAVRKAGLSDVREYLFNPADPPLDHPNSRLRYYLTATAARSPATLPLSSTEEVSTPAAAPLAFAAVPRGSWATSRRSVGAVVALAGCSLTSEALTELRVPSRALCKAGMLMDIVYPTDHRTNCFTKNYARKLEGAGSVYADTASLEEVHAAFAQHSSAECCVAGEGCTLDGVGLRFFAPEEVALLLGFPQTFHFPQAVRLRQRWNLMGNSVNPMCVALVLTPALDAWFALAHPGALV